MYSCEGIAISSPAFPRSETKDYLNPRSVLCMHYVFCITKRTYQFNVNKKAQTKVQSGEEQGFETVLLKNY